MVRRFVAPYPTSNSLIPAQMFLGNEEVVYILDKTDGNAAQIDGHRAWGSLWLRSVSPPCLLRAEMKMKSHQEHQHPPP